jgi:hypothetical protein
VILGGATLSSLGYALLCRSKAALQLRLDRCVESAAAELTSVQNTIEFSNLRLKTERAAAAAASVPTFGASIADAQPFIEAEVALQEGERLRWTVRQTKWITERGCDGRGDLFEPLPNLKWSRPPPDTIGAQPLTWDGSERLVIRLWRANRFAQARVEAKGRSISDKWKAQWIPRIGPSLD